MGINNQEMPNCHFDDAIKKPGPKSRRLNKKFLVFLAFAAIILQVADTAVLWLVGSSKSSQFMGSGVHGDIFMFTAVIFCMLNGIYTKFFLKSRKVCVAEESTAETVPEEPAEDIQQSATTVVDTMKVKGPQEFFPRSAKTTKKAASTQRNSWLRASMPGFTTLNAKAKKFLPLAPNGTLDSDASVFVPHAHVQKEEQLLQSEFGGKYAGPVVYRSTHWLKEICPDTKKPDIKVAVKKSKSKSPTSDARRKPKSEKRWVPKENIVWASQWSNLKDCLQLAA